MFSKVKDWDNRNEQRRKGQLVFTDKGRSWTRRIQWLENQEGNVKLKLEDNVQGYKEVIVSEKDAQTIYERFRAGQSIQDSISILGTDPPQHLKSKRASEQE